MRGAKIWCVTLLPAVICVWLATFLGICYSIASSHGHLDDNGGGNPEISDLGDKDPEHGLFAFGFTCIALLLPVLVWLRHAAVAAATAGAGPTIAVLNSAWAVVALASLPAMLTMAYVRESASDAHFEGAIATFGLVAIFETIHAVLAALALRAGHPLERGDKALSGGICIAYVGLLTVGFISTLVWIPSDGNATAEYFAASMPFAYLLLFTPSLHYHASTAMFGGAGGAAAKGNPQERLIGNGTAGAAPV